MDLWEIAGRPPMDGNEIGKCRICGGSGSGQPFSGWVRPTFTNHDKLQSGSIICHACQFLFDESSELLATRVGKEKPQRMRNYSHFVVGGVWYPLSKCDKGRMKTYLFGTDFPRLVVIAESGQKHILFRAMWNSPGLCDYGYIQFEEQGAFVNRSNLQAILSSVEKLYIAFSKESILTGRYNTNFIMKHGSDWWWSLEQQIQKYRRTLLLEIAVFLAQKGEDREGESGGIVADNLARNPIRLQAQIHEYLGAI